MKDNRYYEEIEIEEVSEFRPNNNEENGIPFDEYEKEKEEINDLYKRVYEFGYFD